jgi:hypothetical protein
MTDEEKKAWEKLLGEARWNPGGPHPYRDNADAIVAADKELDSLYSQRVELTRENAALRARVAVLEKENKTLEKIARDTLGTLFAERYIRETRAALDAAKEG